MTTETKEFSTLLVATVITGIALRHTTFAEIQECAEWLCGHPVWTHELAHPEIQRRYKTAGEKQFPLMPSRTAVDMSPTVAAAVAVEMYGETVQVARGDFVRDKNPVETLRDLKPGADVVVVKT